MKGWDGSHKWLYLYLAYTLELITYFTATSHIYNSAHSLQNRNRQRHRSYQIIFLINSPFVGSETEPTSQDSQWSCWCGFVVTTLVVLVMMVLVVELKHQVQWIWFDLVHGQPDNGQQCWSCSNRVDKKQVKKMFELSRLALFWPGRLLTAATIWRTMELINFRWAVNLRTNRYRFIARCRMGTLRITLLWTG